MYTCPTKSAHQSTAWRSLVSTVTSFHAFKVLREAGLEIWRRWLWSSYQWHFFRLLVSFFLLFRIFYFHFPDYCISTSTRSYVKVSLIKLLLRLRFSNLHLPFIFQPVPGYIYLFDECYNAILSFRSHGCCHIGVYSLVMKLRSEVIGKIVNLFSFREAFSFL